PATDKTEESGRNPVLPGQPIADQPHPGKPGNPIEAVIPRATRLVPYGNGDINLLQSIQRVSYLSAVGDPWFALHPIPDGNEVVARFVGVRVSRAVSRRCQTLHQCWFAWAPRPCEPTKITRLHAVVNIANNAAHRHADQTPLVQGDRVQIAQLRNRECRGAGS